MMRKRNLEMAMSDLEDIKGPSAVLEQYRTPPEAVSEMLLFACSMGDIDGRTVAELGCGGAPFMIGAVLLGARKVWGCDIDPKSIELASRNIELMKERFPGLAGWNDLELYEEDVADPSFEAPPADTVLMNPPFGAQRKGSDRPFIKRALQVAPVVHSYHNGGTIDFVRKMIEGNGGRITHTREATMDIGRRFSFHEHDRQRIPIVAIRAERAVGERTERYRDPWQD